ncbi:MAG: AI-2E family transporter [Gammaproteobacteria bacterium]
METQDGRLRAAWRWLLAAAAFVVVIGGMREAAEIIVPFLLALSIAIIFLPPLIWMRRHRVPSTVAIIAIFVVVAIAMIGVGALIAHSIGEIIHDLPGYQDRVQVVSKQAFALAHQFGLNISFSHLQQRFSPNDVFGLVTHFFKSFGTMLGSGFLIAFLVVFLLFEAYVLPRKLQSIPLGERHHGSLDFFNAFVDSVQRYALVKTLFSLALGILVALVLWGLGVKYAPLWGMLAFLLNFVPNIGAFMSAIPPILLALLQGGWPLMAEAGGALIFIHFTTGNIIEPIFLGEQLGLSTLVVFISLIFWAWVLGPVGMLLSVPLTMIIRIGFESYPETRWMATLLGPPPAHDGRSRLRGWLQRLMPGRSDER